MKQRHYTSLVQARRLVELGLDPETADMNWFEGEPFIETLGFDPDRAKSHLDGGVVKMYEPCWSLGALLRLLPETLPADDFGYREAPRLCIGG